ncbi:MAG: ABC transporter permease [Gemmataceae bacterium]
MNWSVVRLIAGRELRDLLRDRRSLILLLVLPVVIYPGFALAFIHFYIATLEHPSKVGVVNVDALPKCRIGPRPSAAWWAVIPSDLAPAALAISEPARVVSEISVYQPLIADGKFASRFFPSHHEAEIMEMIPLATNDRTPLENKQIDVMLVIPPNFHELLSTERPAKIELLTREGDESSKLAERRVRNMLDRYESSLRLARFAHRGVPADFDSPLVIHSPKDDEPALQRSTEALREQLAHFFPFLLVMWALAGALHPAIDVCAGEKERGTMETLLLSPVKRREIVGGKFLAVGGFSLATALWNLAWMSVLCYLAARFFESPFLQLANLIWCVVLAIPLAGLFSALSLALGVFARSTKEGQYYLLPLFLGVLPLVLLSMMPHMELSWATSLIPVTGTCLVLTKLLGVAPEPGTAVYIVPVLISMVLCVIAAASWAVAQFHREDVLFREITTPK